MVEPKLPSSAFTGAPFTAEFVRGTARVRHRWWRSQTTYRKRIAAPLTGDDAQGVPCVSGARGTAQPSDRRSMTTYRVLKLEQDLKRWSLNVRYTRTL